VAIRVAVVAVSVVSFFSYGGLILATGPLLGLGYVWVIRRAGPVAAWIWLALSIPLASLWGWTLGYAVVGDEVGWLPWTVAILWGSFVSILIPIRRRSASP
jgi:hypothetical protein